MSAIGANKLVHTYNNEYSAWLDDKNLQAAKRQEYINRNPDVIDNYDLERAKLLLRAVDIMDKSISQKSENANIAFESATSLGLGYAAVGGVTVGLIITKLGFVKKYISKFTEKFPKSKNIMPMAITALSGVLGIIAAYPAYTFLSKIESKIHRKRRFESMEAELNDPKIFTVLTEEQKLTYHKNLEKIQNNKNKRFTKEIAQKELKNIKQIINEALYYEKEQNKFREKYSENTDLYEIPLSEQSIKKAKKDKALLLTLTKSLNSKSQSYTEKMQRFTDNLITLSFALASLFTLGYERLAQKMKFKSSSLPASMGVVMLVGSTFFATWAQKRAGYVGRFKAKQELMQNPEQLIYISKKKTDSINDDEIKLEEKQKTNTLKFLKNFFKDNKEYKEWVKNNNLSGRDISKALETIEINSEQLQDGKRLQKNLFKTTYKVDKNTQNYSGKIDIISESVKYPTTLILGTIGSLWGLKHLTRLRASVSPQDIFKNSMKYIGTISLFTLPSLLINSYFAKMQKMGARISDMATMKDLEDYRFFVDYDSIK